MLEAGRARRISSTSSSTPNQYKQAKQKLVDKEEKERTKRLEQQEQRIQKLVRVEERIGILEQKLKDSTILESESSELEGLQRIRENFEEQYDPTEFADEHLAYKALHNDVFARLVRWCESHEDRMQTNVFFLDGPDGGTASSLIHQGKFDPSQCFVANRHESTCVALRESGGGLLPDGNVVHATSSEALTKGNTKGTFAEIDFMGFYFDGCSGFAPHIVNMISSALLVLDDDNETLSRHHDKPSHPIVVGYSLLGGTKNLVEKELEVSRAVTIIARTRGMRMVHALEDPSRFELPNNVPKLGGKRGTTFTTWLILEPETNILR